MPSHDCSGDNGACWDCSMMAVLSRCLPLSGKGFRRKKVNNLNQVIYKESHGITKALFVPLFILMSSQQQQIPSNLLEKDNRSETTIQSDRQTIHDASSIKDAPPANKPSSSSPKAWYKSIFTGPSSGDDPRNYSRRKKTFILMVVSIAGSM